MLSTNAPRLSALAVNLAACSDNTGPAPGPAVDPTDPAQFIAPTGETLAFGVQDGNLRNYFHRQGPRQSMC